MSQATMNKGMLIITSEDEFNSIINEFENSCNNIRNIIENEKNNCNKLNGTTVWQGKAGTSFYEKYSLLNSNYDQIDYSLEIYTDFLKKTLEDYRLSVEEEQKNIKAMAERLTVNS